MIRQIVIACLRVVLQSSASVLESAIKDCASLDASACSHKLHSAVALDPFAHFYLGLLEQQRPDPDLEAALQHYEAVLSVDPQHTDSLNNIGKCLTERARQNLEPSKEHDLARAYSSWMLALTIDSSHRMARMNVALHLHAQGHYAEALDHWKILLNSDPNDGEAAYNAAVSLQYLGQIEEAADAYAAAIRVKPLYTEALINLAALHHRYGSIEQAVDQYQKAVESLSNDDRPDRIDLLIMICNNLGVAQVQLGKFAEATVNHEKALSLAESTGAINEAEQTRAHILKASIPSCYWENREFTVRFLMDQDRRRLDRGLGPVLLPFDTLLLPIDGDTRLSIAKAQSRAFEHHQTEIPSRNPDESLMTVAYLCYDFNDHPTAHLVCQMCSRASDSCCEQVEGLFRWHKRLKEMQGAVHGTYTAAISYGKDDQSSYRASIVSNSDAFINVNNLGYREAVEEARRWPQVLINGSLRAYGPSIAIDLQGHTLGTRMELAAMRVAPVQATYLIFPGTSGASFIDAILVDSIVVPPESARTFAEKLVYLPGCYQINDYERHQFSRTHSSREQHVDRLRKTHGLPAAPSIVFCNFNKNDKLDPTSFSVWMSVMRRVPDSVLWMLQPSKRRAFDTIRSNLQAEAAANGIRDSRIVWASRVPKVEHLVRHEAADLFLDTFVYGAHSTATDALRGGVPFLTMRGQTFPQRVGVSLLSNVGASQSLLACDSLKEFEDMAVFLATSKRSTLEHLRSRLIEEGMSAPLFNTALFTYNMERAFKLMWEQFRADSNRTRRHLVVAHQEYSQIHPWTRMLANSRKRRR